MRLLCVAVLSGFLGCSSHGGGSDSESHPDAGPPLDAEPPPDAYVPLPTDVIGRSHVICRQAAGNTDIATDLSSTAIRAWVPDGSGYREVTGAGSKDGSFVVHDVPVDATYLLQVGASASSSTSHVASYWVTDRRVIDLHVDQLNRCAPPIAKPSAAIPITLDATGMTAFQSNDRLQLTSLALGAFDPVIGPAIGSTTLRSASTWSRGAGLVDAALGDDFALDHLQLIQMTSTDGVQAAATRIAERLEATGLTMHDGVTVALSGAFRKLPANRQGTVTIDNAALESGYDRSTLPFGSSVAVLAEPPERVGGGAFSNAAMWSFSTSVRPRTGASMFAYQFADPYPDAWLRTAVVSTVRFRDVRLADHASAPIGFGGTSQQIMPYRNALVIGHVMDPPEGITVDGVDFARGGAIAFDGTAPVVIRWNPRSDTQLYRLVLGRVDLSATGTPITDTLNITTADSSVTVPPALIKIGARYQLVAEAIQTSIAYRTGELALRQAPASAGVPSARFRFLPSCGDGVVQSGEDCDTGGDSATCNADCTVAVCGDGVVNTAAGEACDTVQASDTCTASCQLP